LRNNNASSRRQFIETLALTSAASALAGCGTSAVTSQRWRGFNLQEKFTDRPDEWASMDPEWGHSNEPFVESDFERIARLGFNFVRLPMSYRCWTDPNDPFRLLEPTLLQIDQAVNWGRQYGIHTCLNFHRAPGFCINGQLSPEPWNLWTDQLALDIFTFHWTQFAQRYKGLPSVNVSFNLINEPNGCTMAQYKFHALF
jgi:endoglucanase